MQVAKQQPQGAQDFLIAALTKVATATESLVAQLCAELGMRWVALAAQRESFARNLLDRVVLAKSLHEHLSVKDYAFLLLVGAFFTCAAGDSQAVVCMPESLGPSSSPPPLWVRRGVCRRRDLKKGRCILLSLPT